MIKRLILLLVLVGIGLPSLPSRAQNGADTFADLADFEAALASATGDLEAFWNRVLAHGTMPLIFDDTAVFLYRGAGNRVEWRGDFSGWDSQSTYRGQRLAESDIWVMSATFPRDARLDYKVVVNGGDWRLDPMNPQRQMGGFGFNNYFAMPDWVYPTETLEQADIPHGTLSETIIIESSILRYKLGYQVYTPYAYETLDTPLPTIYVTDGQEYVDPDMGSMVNVLDNLIANGDMRPVIAVFIDARDPNIRSANRREVQFITNNAYVSFLTDELVPTIQADYRVSNDPAATAILGTSLGGLNAAYVGLQRSDVFGLIGIHSPAFWIAPQVMEAYAESAVLPLKIFMSTGLIADVAEEAQLMRDILEDKGYPLLYVEVNDGHSWGAWRGLLDEPLVYFFGSTQ